jgi:hypothetical protein
MPPKPEQNEQQPGADRFWGQFSQSKAGRSTAGTETEAEAGKTGDPGRAGQSGHGDCLEWCPICRSAELFRNTVSPELRQQAESIQHEAIGVLKAFLDAYAEKAGSESGAQPAGHDAEEPPTPTVTDIPLD